MIVYILAYPVYSFILPVWSFWHMDDFSWGATRVVIGEKGNKQVIALADEGFDPRSIPLMRWDDYAAANGLPSRRGAEYVGPAGQMDTGYLQQTGFIGNNAGFGNEKHYPIANVSPYRDDGGYEMDEMRSTYSTVRPASTIMTGLQTPYNGAGAGGGFYQPSVGRPASTVMSMGMGAFTPQQLQMQQMQQQQMMMMQHQQQQQQQTTRPTSFLPNPLNRQSTYSSLSMPLSSYGHAQQQQYPQQQQQQQQQQQPQQQSYHDYPSSLSPAAVPTTPNAAASMRPTSTMGMISPYASPPAGSPTRNPFATTPLSQSRPGSMFGALGTPLGTQQNASTMSVSNMGVRYQQNQHYQPSNAEITSAIRSCLAVVDLDEVTKKQLKAMAEMRLPGAGGGLSEERKRWMDAAIDAELAGM